MIVCLIANTNHRYKRPNDPVNMAVIERISRGREAYYPDNNGIPTIEFYREAKVVVQWRFDSEKDRDRVFADIIDGKEILK